jgi:DNA-3-methyladenine glycosylase
MTTLGRDFYHRDPRLVARDLLGKLLVRRAREGTTAGRIVEVEAYLSLDDSACHAARGRTRSNAAMFGRAGLAYVYPIHSRYCFNTVTQERGCASAVLIRAVEPLEGITLMQQRRSLTKPTDLARGPGRLCQAFAIDRQLDHWDLTVGRRLWINESKGISVPHECVGVTQRIGVTSAQHLKLRYFVIQCPFVSGPGKLNRAHNRYSPQSTK